MFNSIAYALGQSPQQASESPPVLSFFLMLLMMFAIMYLLVIRPQSKAHKEHEKMIASLKKNDEVIAAGGIHGTIVNVKEKTFILRVDDNVKIEVSKSAVTTLKKKAEG